LLCFLLAPKWVKKKILNLTLIMVTLDKEKNNISIFQINYLVLTSVSILIFSGFKTMGKFGVFSFKEEWFLLAAIILICP